MSDPSAPTADLGSALTGLEAARGRMHAQLEAARARNAALHALAADARSAEATVRSPRGELEVTAGADGGILSVRFAESALDLSPGELGRLTTEIAAAAQRAAAELLRLPG